MFTRVTAILFSLGASLSMLWLATVLWQSVQTIPLAKTMKGYAVKVPAYSVEPLKLLLKKGQFRTGQVNDTRALAEIYTQRKPLDPRGWLWRSDFSHRHGELDKSQSYLAVAHVLSRRNSVLLPRVFNRYAEYGKLSLAAEVARNLIFANPHKMERYVYFMSRLRNDYPALINEIVPDKISKKYELPQDFYFQKTMQLALRLDDAVLAEAVWNAAPAETRSDSKFGSPYAKYLGFSGDIERTKAVWEEVIGEKLVIGQLSNGGFETQELKQGLCWDVSKVKGVITRLDKENTFEGSSSLALIFDGTTNIDYRHSVCTILVKENHNYVLSGMWSGQEVTTLSGPFIDVVSVSNGDHRVFAKSEPKQGSWTWKKFQLAFNVPDDIKILQLRIRRSRTPNLDNQIAGTVWFDNLKLTDEGRRSEFMPEFQGLSDG